MASGEGMKLKGRLHKGQQIGQQQGWQYDRTTSIRKVRMVCEISWQKAIFSLETTVDSGSSNTWPLPTGFLIFKLDHPKAVM
jgi:hypothetical protein